MKNLKGKDALMNATIELFDHSRHLSAKYEYGEGYFSSEVDHKLNAIMTDDLCPKYDPFNNMLRCNTHQNGILTQVLI